MKLKNQSCFKYDYFVYTRYSLYNYNDYCNIFGLRREKMIGTTMSYLNAVSMMQNATNSIASNVYSIYNANLYIQLLKRFFRNKRRGECVRWYKSR